MRELFVIEHCYTAYSWWTSTIIVNLNIIYLKPSVFFVRESLRSFLLNNDIYSFRKKRALSSSHWTGGSTRNTPARRGIVLIQDLTD